MAILLSFVLLCALCAVLAWIDIRHGIIPDWLNLSIAALGLLKIVLSEDRTAAIQALGEGVAVGAAFWLLRRLYFAFRGIQGLGLGDVKFLGAAGIWVGVAGHPDAVAGRNDHGAGLCRRHAAVGARADGPDFHVVRAVSRRGTARDIRLSAIRLLNPALEALPFTLGVR